MTINPAERYALSVLIDRFEAQEWPSSDLILEEMQALYPNADWLELVDALRALAKARMTPDQFLAAERSGTLPVCSQCVHHAGFAGFVGVAVFHKLGHDQFRISISCGEESKHIGPEFDGESGLECAVAIAELIKESLEFAREMHVTMEDG